MSTLLDRFRNRRLAERRSRAIEQAMRNAPSTALRRELLEIVNRYE
jgi:hypothetical protein